MGNGDILLSFRNMEYNKGGYCKYHELAWNVGDTDIAKNID